MSGGTYFMFWKFQLRTQRELFLQEGKCVENVSMLTNVVRSHILLVALVAVAVSAMTPTQLRIKLRISPIRKRTFLKHSPVQKHNAGINPCYNTANSSYHFLIVWASSIASPLNFSEYGWQFKQRRHCLLRSNSSGVKKTN